MAARVKVFDCDGHIIESIPEMANYMDPAIREELNAFVAKRKAEGGAPTDF